MLELKEKIFYNEYAMGAYQFMQTVLLFMFEEKIHKNQRLSLLGGFMTFFIHKQLKEGTRANSFLLLFNEALLLLRQSGVVTIPYWALFSTMGLYLLSIQKLKVYSFPKPGGAYQVGYIHRVERNLLRNPQKELAFSVYYPCVYDPNKRDRNWMITHNYWRRMHDTNMKDKERPGKVPQFFFKIQSQYLYKIQMGVLENASLISVQDLYYKSLFPTQIKKAVPCKNLNIEKESMNKCRNQDELGIKRDKKCEFQMNQENENVEDIDSTIKMDKFPIVIISHGLAAHCNSYTLFAKELASKGYIVFSMEHLEEIKNPHMDREQNRQFRKVQLLERLETSKKLLDLIHNEQYLRDIFKLQDSDESVSIDYDKVSILGHSFGGSAALYTAMNDKRITGVVIGLDPCLYVYEREEIVCQFPRPLLCINSEDFYKRLYPWFQNEENLETMFSNIEEKYKSVSINCTVKGLAHANQSDMAIVMAGEFDLYGITMRGECAKNHMFLNLMLFEYYLDRYLIHNQTNLNKENFLNDYFNMIGHKHKTKYIFSKPKAS